MGFLNDARTIVEQTLSEVGQRTIGYVPRILLRGDVPPEEAALPYAFLQYRLSRAEGKFIRDTEIARLDRVAIIGDAGCGKSYILQNAYLSAADDFLNSSDAPLPFFLDLFRHLSLQRSLAEALDYRYPGLLDRACTEYEPGCILFLDSLDERLLTETNQFGFVRDLLFSLEDYRDVFACVVVACRRVFWNPNWVSDAAVAWNTYHADFLGRSEYEYLIPDPARRQAFFDCAQSLGIEDLLWLPFIGFDLARKFNRGEDLPGSRQAWFQQQMAVMLRGTPGDHERGQAPSLDILLQLSTQLACLATFGGVQTWTVQEAVDTLGRLSVLREWGVITYEQVHALLQRPLFTKTDNLFSFCQQLFREYMAAEALSSLSLRKQQQLLVAPSPHLRHRILTPHRGVAVFLAEMCPPFREYLITNDPLVAFFADAPDLPAEADRRLTKTVIDKAITTQRAYWWEIPPRGERPQDVLPKHRPDNADKFIRPYLERSDEMSLLWGTACASVWGGCSTLNNRLLELAHNDELHVEARVNAVNAIFNSGDKNSIRGLYDLLSCKNDRVRGHVLQAYRMTDSPSPSNYIAKLCGGAYDDNLSCQLQRDVRLFGLSLDAEELREALLMARPYFEEIRNLRGHLFSGLLQRAVELDFYDIPPDLVIEMWLERHPSRVRYARVLRDLLSSSSVLLDRVWDYILRELGQKRRFIYLEILTDHLFKVCNDHIFDLLPTDESALDEDQKALIARVLQLYFAKDPTPNRLHVFRERAPTFTKHLRVLRPASDASSRDLLENRREIAAILNQEEVLLHIRMSQILSIVEKAFPGDKPSSFQPAKVLVFLEDLSAPLRLRILRFFVEVVSQTEYPCVAVDGTNRFKITPPQYAVPFWVLWELQYEFPLDKLNEFIRCYAFSSFFPQREPELYYPLLNRLYELNQERWSETLMWLIESPHVSWYGPLEYLIARQSDLYVGQCRLRLGQCKFDTASFEPMLNYWVARNPPGFEDVLRAGYQCAEEEDQRVSLLYLLLTADDDWAWEELANLVDAGTPPRRNVDLLSRYPLLLPLTPERLPVIADWYLCIRQDIGEGRWPGDLGQMLRESICQIGGEAAIEQLRRLQELGAVPVPDWTSYAILRVEDQMLSIPGETMEVGDLLDFVNREALGVVLNDRDLFEWTCQEIEDVKESLEKRGEQVVGYWNHSNGMWSPKTEPECQNVLWPAVRSRLSSLGIVGVEERTVRADRADFWVEKPLATGQSAQVVVELKVARKGYGPGRLVTPIQTQLWERYLQPSGCRHGIYIVLWFKDSEHYCYPTMWVTPQQLKKDLDDFKQKICEQQGVDIACYVIDMTTPARLH